MRKIAIGCWLIGSVLILTGIQTMAAETPAAVYGSGPNKFSLATGSPGELGLLQVLAETFGAQVKAQMAW